MRKAQEEGLGRFPGESSSDTSLDRPSSASSVATLSNGETASRARHDPFLSPPASLTFTPNETIPPSFSFIGTNVEVPIGGDLVSTVTDIDISAYPFLPESLFPHSTNLQLLDEKNNPAYVFRHGQRTSSSTTPPQLWSLPLIHFLSNVRPDVFHPNSTRKMLFRS